MNSKQFSGVFTALATPMKGGEVAYADLEKLVAHQLEGGINGLVSVGTTGESPTLNKTEHIEVVKATVKAAVDVELLVLDRKTFTRVMGPLTEILKRDMARYGKVMGQQI